MGGRSPGLPGDTQVDWPQSPSGGDEPRNSTAVWPWKLQTNGRDKGRWDKTSSGPRDDPSHHSLGEALGRLPGMGSISSGTPINPRHSAGDRN